MSTYTIQPGDTLLQLAIDHSVEYTELLALNPQYQTNPNYIRAGDSLNLPTEQQVEEIEPDFSIEPPSETLEPQESGEIVSEPECKGIEVHDVLFVTGDAPTDYYCLTEEHQAKLEEEISYTDKLIQDYKEILEKAPQGENITPQAMEQHALKKKAWLESCVYAGAISVSEPKPAAGAAAQAQAKPPVTQAYIASKVTELERRRALIQIYAPRFSELTVEALRDRVLARIDKELAHWKALVVQAPKPEGTNKQGVNLDSFSSKTFQRTPAQRHVVEAWSVSRNRLIYIRADFMTQARNRWVRNPVDTEAMRALRARDWAGLKQAFMNDIQEGIGKDFRAKKLEAAFATWKAEGWKAHEWKAAQKSYNEDGEVLFAKTAEAQLLRFSAQASVKSVLEPGEGKIDIGIGAEASFALAEGAVGIDRYLPYENGYSIGLSYIDANKQPAVYPFGSFRAKISLLMSCFIGGMANGRVALSNQPNPNPGHEVLLAPRVNMGTNASGGVGVKAEIFGGAQVGGQIEGGLEWKAPPDIELDKVFDFATLAKVGANGNVAIGAGAGWDFQLALREGQFVFNCSGRLVFGPGASGGFGTTIDFEQLWKLAVIIFKGLKATDYRILDNLEKEVYEHLMLSSYAAFVADFIQDPKDALKQAIMNTSDSIERWWEDRLEEWKEDAKRKKEAKRLASRIVTRTKSFGSEVTGEVPFEELLPETVGIMLNTLVTTFYFSQEEQQETAIYILLMGAVKTWRRFEEILARMNPTGEKQVADKALFDNLARINVILDGEQQQSFNAWVLLLAEENEINEQNYARMRPYKPRSGRAWLDKRTVVEQQIAKFNNHDGQYYV